MNFMDEFHELISWMNLTNESHEFRVGTETGKNHVLESGGEES